MTNKTEATPQQLIQLGILRKAREVTEKMADKGITSELDCFTMPITLETLDQVYEIVSELNCFYDARDEFREGYIETEIEAPYSRHYESKSVATSINGKWIGWTYWYGGGKHGEPEEVDWIEDAYFLNCKESTITTKIRTFEKR